MTINNVWVLSDVQIEQRTIIPIANQYYKVAFHKINSIYADKQSAMEAYNEIVADMEKEYPALIRKSDSFRDETFVTAFTEEEDSTLESKKALFIINLSLERVKITEEEASAMSSEQSETVQAFEEGISYAKELLDGTKNSVPLCGYMGLTKEEKLALILDKRPYVNIWD